MASQYPSTAAIARVEDQAEVGRVATFLGSNAIRSCVRWPSTSTPTDLAPEERLPRSMMYDHGNGSKMDEEIADGLHA
jgi:hypothetical protein